MGANYLKHGDWNAICDQCGFKFKASQLRKTGDKDKPLYVCRECWDPYHPQDDLKGVPDNPSVPWSRPDSEVSVVTKIDNATYAYVYGTDEVVVDYYTPVSDTQKVFTIKDTGTEVNGSRVILYKTGGGNANLLVGATEGGNLKLITAGINARLTAEYNGSTWRLVDYTTLGL